jgi:hypothetical protein
MAAVLDSPLHDDNNNNSSGSEDTLFPPDVSLSRAVSDADIVERATIEAAQLNKVDGEDDNAKEKSEKDLSHQEKEMMSEWKSLMKKVKIGSDLSQISMGASFSTDCSALMFMRDLFIPTFHLFVETKRHSDPLQRMLQLIKYYISTIKLTQFGKKPLNPILGETVHGRVQHTNMDGSESVLVGEQISHHPPTSAMHIRNATHGVEIDVYAAPKASFWGKHVKIDTNRGYRVYRLKGILPGGGDEEYEVEWPDLYARILRFNAEYCGKPTIRCKQSGLTASFKFKDKPVFGGKWHVVEGFIVHESQPKKNIYEFAGVWNTAITFVNCATKERIVWDRKAVTNDTLVIPPLDTAEPTMAEKVWQGVLENMRKGDMKAADKAKTEIEERQRAKAKRDKEDGRQHVPVHFVRHPSADAWLIKPSTSATL